MRSILKSVYFLCPLLGVITSCSEAEQLSTDGPHQATITATISEPDDKAQSRSCIDMNNTGNGYLGILWQQNDAIGVYGDGTTRNAQFKNLVSGNAATVDFSGEMTGADNPWRAYYPYSSENAGAEITALKGTVPEEQPFDPESGQLVADYKYGAPVNGRNRFNFRHLFSMLRVSINATSTLLEGERLEKIELTVTDGEGKERPINGTFTFSAVDGSWGDVTGSTGTVRMPWTTHPTLTANTTCWGFITVMPTVKQGDKIAVTVVSEAHKATFQATCQVDFQAENIYNIPLTLQHYAENVGEFGYEETELPVIKSFSFSVANNPGKILDNQLTWNSSNKPQFDAVSAQTASIEGSEINLMIPYLYDFKLVPEFTTNADAEVTVDGVKQTSGETVVDFSKPVTYTVTAGGVSREYVVNITNTGLPVVVLNQSASGDFSEVKTGGFLGIGAKVVNRFVDFMIRGKDTDWVKDDQLAIYNADGSISLPTAACGVRLRGNTTQAYPKKPFAIKFDSKQAVLGLPAHKRWVLLANWLDHSMIRNAVAFDVAHAIENAWKAGSIEPGIPWNVHGKSVELVIDGHHVGNYYLCEQIKIDSKRLNIQDPFEDVDNPTFETCGYLFEIDNNYDETDKFITKHYSVPFMFKDEVGDDIFNAVQAKVQSIEDNIHAGNFEAVYEDLDINSVIDQWLVWELTMNHEFLDPRSVYYFMDGDGKLSAGPVWDFDRATFQNVENAQAQGSSGDRLKPYNKWVCWSANPKAGLTTKEELEDANSCVWYPELVTDPIYQAAVQKRWKVVYPYLENVVNDIQGYYNTLKHSYDVNNAMWPTTKKAIQEHKNNFSDWSGDENIASYEDVIENFATVYRKRLDGMNTLITSGKFTE